MIDFKNQRLLVIAPHSDDEVLGCGGLIHRIKAAGGKVYVLFLTLGTTRDYSPSGISTSQMRMQEIIKVMAYLKVDGFDIAFKGAKYHLKLDGIPNLELINIIEKKSKVAIDRVRPNIITTSQLSDYNQDHRSANLATLASTRPSPHDLKPFVPLVYDETNIWEMVLDHLHRSILRGIVHYKNLIGYLLGFLKHRLETVFQNGFRVPVHNANR